MYQTDLHQIFSNGRHMDADDRFDLLFPIAQGTFAMVTNLVPKSAKLVATYLTVIYCTADSPPLCI